MLTQREEQERMNLFAFTNRTDRLWQGHAHLGCGQCECRTILLLELK